MDRAQTELETRPTGVLLRKYAIPAIIAMTATSLYNIVDSIFIGRGVGPYALSGLAVTFPFMNLTSALGTLVGVGASTLLSIKLGKKDYAAANRIFGNEIMLNLILSVAFTAICLVFLEPILHFFGASDDTISYATEYMEVIIAGSAVTFIFQGLNHLLRSSGYPGTAMYSMLVTVVINIILDYLFIFVFSLGIRGAAYATIISQTISLVWLVVIYSNPSKVLHFQKNIYRPDWKLIGKSLEIGMSPFLLNLVTTLVVIVVNRQLSDISGDLAIGAYGIVNRVWFIFVMIVLGITHGMQPIVGYNYGAGRMDRAVRTLRNAIFSIIMVLLPASAICIIFPSEIVGLFTDNGDMAAVASEGLKFLMMTLPVLGVQMGITIFFQSVGFPRKSIFLNLFRQLAVLIPLLYILPPIAGLRGIWYSWNISDSLSFLLAGVLLYRYIIRLPRSHQ